MRGQRASSLPAAGKQSFENFNARGAWLILRVPGTVRTTSTVRTLQLTVVICDFNEGTQLSLPSRRPVRRASRGYYLADIRIEIGTF